MLLKIEITSFPYMEIISHKKTKNCIHSHFVIRYSCSAIYLKFIQFIFDHNNTMPFLDRNLPVKSSKCEKMVVKQQMARHKKSCDSGTLKCPKCSHFYTEERGLELPPC